MRVKGMKGSWAVAIIAIATLGTASSANAQKVELGGRTSITAFGAVIYVDPDASDDVTTLLIGGSANYTTENARFEGGLGVTFVGIFSDFGDVQTYNPIASARVNTNLLGPEENLLLYGGGVVGVSIIRGDFEDEIGIFGPKAGVEFYVTPDVALQVEDQFLFDSEGGTQNVLQFGFKVLF